MATELHLMIKKVRENSGLSQFDFAHKIGASLSSLKKWEKGEVKPGTKYLQRICEEFKCDMDYLTGRIGKSKHIFEDICKLTGLSEKAVKVLISAKKNGYAEALTHLIESKGIINFMRAYSTFYELLSKLEYIDSDYKAVGFAAPDLRMRENGQVVMSTDEAIHHYITRTSMLLTKLCDMDYDEKVKKLPRRSLDDYKYLCEEIAAGEKELDSLKNLKQWLEKEENT